MPPTLINCRKCDGTGVVETRQADPYCASCPACKGSRRIVSTAPPAPCPVAAKVAAEVLARAAIGQAKYGHTLARRDLPLAAWAKHAKEEAMDLANYSQRIEDGSRLLDEARIIIERLTSRIIEGPAKEWLARFDAQFPKP